MNSLSARLLLAAAAVLALFVLLTSLALEQAFADAARSAREERLLAQLFLLMAAAEVEDGRLIMPVDLAEPRLSLPSSGLSARIFDAAGVAVWQSRSAMEKTQPAPVQITPGERRFSEVLRGDKPAQDSGDLAHSLKTPLAVLQGAVQELGIDARAAERLLERGVRADESAPGHGIGLAVVREICAAYGGGVEIRRGSLGGALIRLQLRAGTVRSIPAHRATISSL